MTKISFFILKFLVFIFCFLKFNTLSSDSLLTQNPNSKLVNHKIKIFFNKIFIENYFGDKNFKNDILENFSFNYMIFLLTI